MGLVENHKHKSPHGPKSLKFNGPKPNSLYRKTKSKRFKEKTISSSPNPLKTLTRLQKFLKLRTSLMAFSRRSLVSLFNRALSSSPASSSSSLSSRTRFAAALINNHSGNHFLDPVKILTRPKTSGPGYSPLNDPSPNWGNRPPKETILMDGCDYEHCLVVLEFPDLKPSEQVMIDAYVKTLAFVLGSEEEVKKKILTRLTWEGPKWYD